MLDSALVRQTDYATIRLLASVAAFPLFWSLETSLVGWAGGLRWALAFFLSLPLGGLIARRLLAERRELVEELERARRDYAGGRERTKLLN